MKIIILISLLAVNMTLAETLKKSPQLIPIEQDFSHIFNHIGSDLGCSGKRYIGLNIISRHLLALNFEGDSDTEYYRLKLSDNKNYIYEFIMQGHLDGATTIRRDNLQKVELRGEKSKIVLKVNNQTYHCKLGT